LSGLSASDVDLLNGQGGSQLTVDAASGASFFSVVAMTVSYSPVTNGIMWVKQ
jgi:hypothetical protein